MDNDLHASKRWVIDSLIAESAEEILSGVTIALRVGGSKRQSDASEYKNSTKN